MRTTQSFIRGLSVLVAGAFIGLFLTGCAATSKSIPHGVLEEIPQNANRVILDQEGVPPADVYVDALMTLKNQGFDVVSSKETLDLDKLSDILENEPLVFAARKQIQPDLAIRITGDARTIPGGGRLIASIMYANNVNDNIEQWKDARWSSGKSREAFFQGLEILRGTRYDAMDFEIGVAVSNTQ